MLLKGTVRYCPQREIAPRFRFALGLSENVYDLGSIYAAKTAEGLPAR